MSNLVAADALSGMTPSAPGALDGREPFRVEGRFFTIATFTGTNALAEQPIFVARRKMRVIGFRFAVGAAVTGAATNYFSIVVAVRHAAAPATQKIIATYNADTATTKDIAAFASRDFWASGDVNAAAVDADFILAAGDVVTITVTKAGTGMTCPIFTASSVCEARD